MVSRFPGESAASRDDPRRSDTIINEGRDSMEFFAIAECRVKTDRLRELLTIDALPRICDSIDSLLQGGRDKGRIYCLWGEFEVHREIINGGVRFTMPHCPNAMAWTITTGHPPAAEAVVVHCTIARRDHEPDFLESVETWVDDWKRGIERAVAAAGAG